MESPSILENGYILEPGYGKSPINAPADPSWPTVIAPVHNLPEFSQGEDIVGRGFIAKQSGWDMCVLPREHRDFLPALQAILDDQYAAGDATKKAFMVRASRHTAAIGEPHQSHMAGFHRHREEGAGATIYSASDILGTYFLTNAKATFVPKAKTADEFYDNLKHHGASAAPPGAIVRFGVDMLHSTPSPEKEEERRRTFYVVVAYENDIPSGRYDMKTLSLLSNPLGAYVHPQRADRQEIMDAWRDNTRILFEQLATRYDGIRQPEAALANTAPR